MDTSTELQCRVQHLVREAQHKLRTSDDEKELQLTLDGVAALLPSGRWHPALTTIPKDRLREASHEFMDRHYVHFAEFLLSRVTAEWQGKLAKGRTGSVFDVFFLRGAPVDSFTLLCGAIAGSRSVTRPSSLVTYITPGAGGADMQLGSVTYSHFFRTCALFTFV